MISAFIEVLKDLWIFATQSSSESGNKTRQKNLVRRSFDKSGVDMKSPATSVSTHALESKVCYVQKKTLLCLQVPQKKFDTLRGLLRYGDSVRVVHQKNNWSFVENTSLQGWVESQCLTEDVTEVFPDLQTNQSYDAQNNETKKLRLYICDEMLGSELGLVLQSTEYILYRLKRVGKNIQWPLERPRMPGMWRNILKDKKGVAIGLEPKTGSVVECTSNKSVPFLAFVETVTPDETIVISSVGKTEVGVFEKAEYTKEQWQQWSPVFISFT